MDYGCAGAQGSLFEGAACQRKRPGPSSVCSITPREETGRAGVDQRRQLRHHFPRLSPQLSLTVPPLPQVMYYECCLITEPRILQTGWHIYLFVLYLFASHLYAKSFCDRLVYSLALPRRDQTNEQIEEGRRAIDGQSSGRCAAG